MTMSCNKLTKNIITVPELFENYSVDLCIRRDKRYDNNDKTRETYNILYTILLRFQQGSSALVIKTLDTNI